MKTQNRMKKKTNVVVSCVLEVSQDTSQLLLLFSF